MNPRALLRLIVIGVLALVVLIVADLLLAPRIAASRLRAAARGRGLEASWRSLELQWPPAARLRGLSLRHAVGGDTLLSAEVLDVRLQTAPLLTGRVRPRVVVLSGARVRLGGARAALSDTLAPVPEPEAGVTPAVAQSVRRRADEIVNMLLVPARALPELHLRDVAVFRGTDPVVTIDGLDLTHEPAADNLAMAGTAHGQPETPFDLLLRWGSDDRLTGRAEFKMKESEPPSPASLVVLVDGRITQDVKAGEVRIADGTQVRMGQIVTGITGRVSANGPRFQIGLAAGQLSADAFRRSLPARVLGPLAGLELRGTFDWRAGADLDLSRPDSVRFYADVTPHGLELDPALSRPSLQAIGGPFTAQIHLPHDRIVTRQISDLNPHYRPLDHISPYLRDALVTNEDGGFWRHRGFNSDAIGLALAANLRAGSYKRGAGTITMQLARNLWLGHHRTLSRKAQEVAMAWLLEHETGLSKERLLEVYLNVIEWGPDVHGADEAARYYFDEDASRLTLPEALFLTIVVPSPGKWRWRFFPDGTLRPFARAQMHFIARKMATKGWLDPALVPEAAALDVTLRGPARSLFAAPDTVTAPVDSLTDEPI